MVILGMLTISSYFPLHISSAWVGAIATIGSITLALPEHTIACALRQPIILTCITLMGGIEASRSWRIALLVCPKLGAEKSNEKKVQLARSKVLRGLSRLLDCTKAVTRCKRSVAVGNKSLRRQVTLADSMWVTTFLVLPQIILQVLNLSVTELRVHSIQIEDNIYTCQSKVGSWTLVVGIILTVIPFLLALILNVQSEGMPNVFREYNQIATSIRLCVGMLFTTLPSISMAGDLLPDVNAYLLGASVLSFVLPLSYQIAWVKLHLVKGTRRSDANQNQRRRSTIKRLPSNTSSEHRSGEDSLEVLAAADDANTVSSMFNAMGRVEKSLEADLDVKCSKRMVPNIPTRKASLSWR